MKYQKCNSCQTVFHDKTWIDICPICRSENISRKPNVMKMISIRVACKDSDAEHIEKELINSDSAQLGIYAFGTEVRDLTDNEENEVMTQVPTEILDNYMKGKET